MNRFIVIALLNYVCTNDFKNIYFLGKMFKITDLVTKSIVLGSKTNRLIVTVILNTNNICFGCKMRK